MPTRRPVLRHPLDHPIATFWTIALGAAGQLVVTWALARAAEAAERDEGT